MLPSVVRPLRVFAHLLFLACLFIQPLKPLDGDLPWQSQKARTPEMQPSQRALPSFLCACVLITTIPTSKQCFNLVIVPQSSFLNFITVPQSCFLNLVIVPQSSF
jgi:hypothetical protein